MIEIIDRFVLRTLILHSVEIKRTVQFTELLMAAA